MNAVDHFIHGIDGLVRTIARVKISATTPSPSHQAPSDLMTNEQTRLSGALMRVNHSGEVCAQGLYNGQALFASEDLTSDTLAKAADEELDHLSWCRERLDELGYRSSIFDPLWYGASFFLGATTSLISDRISLGFVHATEANVERHLREHLDRLPSADHASHKILERMLDDEIRHGQDALKKGGQELPKPIRHAMWESAKIMTKISEKL
ncbi:2-polyprenyl-3-methyl-6-methoxy-1,4-benzoquinone monooxygenase [Litorivicinus sp.]|jgi:ubiquinone biosynthesis monooxygenase Coq7|nr:2-polyprenyl-3-methyl-6-methoxy-1,4-benzoquinone monooxygenase [Litorivicinus sp.]MDC1208692.1 2-polyprenyl-3-methyl-6-methoxy-1,4-benzoquinone monooxygenase [Litorivicinus sp.]MDC1239752.1 2-polyprenyl-3-methyl-6-methoxy-1,4-benzoquinone monooxygenase [Litorivicinus sp.]MDC1466215.1 2-polyprenyl-3-methyl-6-methoxy-1,4-benzoquinone monooxygenase [Litorivicinus sp.]|tara:strand:- start:16894 stop:17523 length:630 start_codon:yes stop_codon:yes gene_type:complete